MFIDQMTCGSLKGIEILCPYTCLYKFKDFSACIYGCNTLHIYLATCVL